MVAVHGDLAFGSTDRFVKAVAEIADGGADVVAVDLADVPFMDSSGIGALLEARRRLEAIGGRLAVWRPQPKPMSLLARMQLDRVIAVADSLEEAFARSERLAKEADRRARPSGPPEKLVPR